MMTTKHLRPRNLAIAAALAASTFLGGCGSLVGENDDILLDTEGSLIAEIAEEVMELELQCCNDDRAREVVVPMRLDDVFEFVRQQRDLGTGAPLTFEPSCIWTATQCRDPLPDEDSCEDICKAAYGTGQLGEPCDATYFEAQEAQTKRRYGNTGPVDTCVQDLICGPAGRCVDPCERIPLGEDCHGPYDCGTGEYCEGWTFVGKEGQCAVAGAIGESCGDGLPQCDRATSYCADESADPTCVALEPLGGQCNDFSDCRSGYCGPTGGWERLDTPATCEPSLLATCSRCASVPSESQPGSTQWDCPIGDERVPWR